MNKNHLIINVKLRFVFPRDKNSLVWKNLIPSLYQSIDMVRSLDSAVRCPGDKLLLFLFMVICPRSYYFTVLSLNVMINRACS